MASLPELTIWVKGNPSKGERGDCPFSHKALLSLANKGVQYREVYLDLNAKPEVRDANIKPSALPRARSSPSRRASPHLAALITSSPVSLRLCARE